MSAYVRSKKEIREHRILKFVMALPVGFLLKIFRQNPISLDGQILHPEMQLILLLRKLKKSAGMGDRPPVASRKSLLRDARVHGLSVKSEIKTEEISIPSNAGHSIKARLYRSQKPLKVPTPLLVFIHGGGFVLGDIEMYDHVCRFICEESALAVLSVDYRLAPEHPFPSGLEDSITAYRWACRNAERLGLNSKRIAVGGDSAGANFATHIAQVMAKEGKDQPAYQWLIYPTTDQTQAYPSASHFSDGFFLRTKDIAYFNEHYGATDAKDERISPIVGPLKGLAPALIVTAGFDPLRDEGEAYAKALESAGNKVQLIRFPDMIHGFMNMIGISPQAKRYLAQAIHHLKVALHD